MTMVCNSWFCRSAQKSLLVFRYKKNLDNIPGVIRVALALEGWCAGEYLKILEILGSGQFRIL